MESVLVTIAIPAYKSMFLSEAISSAINQTYSNIDVIIVNDQSPEDISGIVHSFNDERIRYFVNEKNVGGQDLAANWNICLDYAKGDFFCLLCDDDKYEPTFIEEMVSLSIKYPKVDVFRGRAQVIDKSGKIIGLYPASPEYESVYDYMWQKWAGFRFQTISEFMVRTDHAKTIGGYFSLPRAWASDSISIYLFGMKHGIASSWKTLVNFRNSGINVSSNMINDSRDKIKATFLCRRKSEELVNQCQDNVTKSLLLKYESNDFESRVSYILCNCPPKEFLWIIWHYPIPIKLLIKSLRNRFRN